MINIQRFSRERILNGTSAKIWYGAKNIAENSIDDYMDRAHFPDYDNYNYMQIIINMKCNKFMNKSREFCCS
ncbi:hypothetical protein Avbf_13994 [Armadillidium vulgare]|nr:hypothetical protein Avbf_13994 [Armadillidium vulgare]